MKDDRLISLNAAIHVIKDALLSWSNMPEWRENKIVGALDKLPSAQPVEDTRAMCGECDAWNQYKNYPQPGWIPCSTALPKTEEKVFVTCEHLDIYGKPHRYVCKAYHVDRYTVRADFDYWDEGCDEYCEEDDQYYVLDGWYEYIHNWGDYSSVRITEDKVVAWCPLREPYKGGQP